MRTIKHWALAAASAAALVLAGCGGGGSGGTATGPTTPTEPSPMAASGTVMLHAEAQAALLMLLPDPGDSDMVEIPAGGTVTREGVTFSCESDYPCMLTVTNSLGTIVAEWSSQTLGDGMATVMASGLEMPVDTFAALNSGNLASIREDVVGTGADSSTVGPNLTPTELIGMGIGGSGVTDAGMAGLRSDFQANGADFGTSPGDVAAAPGLAPALTMGTTITGADDAVDPSPDMAPAPDGWVMKTLFRDWGDTTDSGGGGFETAAIVVKNWEAPMMHPFDSMLSGRFATTATQYALTRRNNGAVPDADNPATSVDINSDSAATNTASSEQWAAMVFDSDSLVPAQTQDPNIDQNETFRGTYFGVPGEFQCIEADDADPSCGLARNAEGAVMVIDTDAATAGIQGGGRWTFTPDAGGMITVPDQDWLVYGAWLTTPNDAAGDHRLGVFFNGMDTWTGADNLIDATNDAGLHGMASYSGGAAGIYVDGMASGLFTATASLMAKFDVDGDGTADTGDYTVSGHINDFRGTDGVALGDDAGANDWVVNLGSVAMTAGGNLVATGTTGRADGVDWTGSWDGQLFGPSATTAPSGVAGRFWAETADPDAADTAENPVTAVVGAFGATRNDN